VYDFFSRAKRNQPINKQTNKQQANIRNERKVMKADGHVDREAGGQRQADRQAGRQTDRHIQAGR